jgi:hypothetical protein
MRRLTLPALLFLAAPACSGEVVIATETSGASSGAGSGGGTTGSTSGASTTGGGTSGVGGAPACFETHDKLTITLSTWEGPVYGCDGVTGEHEYSASVVGTPEPGLLVLDSCPPTADCAGQLSKLSLVAPDINFYVPHDAYVRVRVSIYPFMGGCAQRVQIKNLPSWYGVPNPVQGGEALWFFGVDGDPSGFPDTPIQATAEALGCFPNEPGGCGEHEDYAWRFQPTGNLADPGVVVAMGEWKQWGATLEGQLQPLVLRNLRSYSSGYCDGPVDLAYFVGQSYPLD